MSGQGAGGMGGSGMQQGMQQAQPWAARKPAAQTPGPMPMGGMTAPIDSLASSGTMPWQGANNSMMGSGMAPIGGMGTPPTGPAYGGPTMPMNIGMGTPPMGGSYAGPQPAFPMNGLLASGGMGGVPQMSTPDPRQQPGAVQWGQSRGPRWR